MHSILTAIEVVRARIPPGTDGQIARCFTSSNCDPTTEFDFTTVADCCLSEQGLSYFRPGIEVCGECICKYQALHVLYFSIAS